MPFRVHYEIFDNKHKAPGFQTYDYTMARIEWNDRKRNPKGLMYRLEQTVMPDGKLIKPEEYLFLVYRVRKLTIQYRSGGYKDEDKFVLSEHVRKLDKWNKRTRQFLDTHTKVMDAETTKRMAFFILVEAWRNTYHERQAYSKQPGYEKAVYVQMTRNDPRLELCDDNERFLALLIDCVKRDVILGTKRCRSLFGGTVYHWRKIARKCPITDVASAISECGSGYYGRGWIIAVHIERLRTYILETSSYSKIQKLISNEK